MNVYYLIDPVDDIIRYIGISKHPPKKRLAGHIKESKGYRRRGRYLSKKHKWILKLLDNNLKPVITEKYSNLTQVEAERIEIDLIAQYGRVIDGGQLFNYALGGNDYSCKTTPWNRGKKNIYSKEDIEKMKLNQDNRKPVVRYNKSGEEIDRWVSIRTMCSKLSFDRRTIMRILKKEPNYLSLNGFMFAYEGEHISIYHNKSKDKSLSNSPHAVKINQLDLNGNFMKEWGSITEASIAITGGASGASGISTCLSGGQVTSMGFKWSRVNKMQY